MAILTFQELVDVIVCGNNMNRLWESGGWCMVVVRTRHHTGEGSKEDGDDLAPFTFVLSTFN